MTTAVKEGRMQAHRITLRSGARSPDLSFLGELLVEVSSHGEFPLRWTDMALYRVHDSAYQYALQTVGRSVVYHHESGCFKGVRMTVGRMRKDARWGEFEPCREKGCQPPIVDNMRTTWKVSVEEDIYRAHACTDVDALMSLLRRPGTVADPQRPMEDIGYVGVRLLDSAAEVDRKIAQAIRTTKRL